LNSWNVITGKKTITKRLIFVFAFTKLHGLLSIAIQLVKIGDWKYLLERLNRNLEICNSITTIRMDL